MSPIAMALLRYRVKADSNLVAGTVLKIRLLFILMRTSGCDEYGHHFIQIINVVKKSIICSRFFGYPSPAHEC